MPLVVVTLCHSSMANQISLPGKHVTCVNQVSITFAILSNCPSAVEDSDLQALERFVVLMYDRSSDVTTVNEARHAKRDSHEGGYVWRQALKRHPQTPSPSDWGWVEQGEEWKVLWTPLPPIAEHL